MNNLLAASSAGALVVPVLLVIGMIVGLFVAWRLVRRFFFADEGVSSTKGWDLEEIRRLREAGQISQAEYERLIKVASSKLASEFGPPSRSPGRRSAGLHSSDPLSGLVGPLTLNMLHADLQHSQRDEDTEQEFESGGQHSDTSGGMDFGGGASGSADSGGSD